jgi:hypothetical protein
VIHLVKGTVGKVAARDSSMNGQATESPQSIPTATSTTESHPAQRTTQEDGCLDVSFTSSFDSCFSTQSQAHADNRGAEASLPGTSALSISDLETRVTLPRQKGKEPGKSPVTKRVMPDMHTMSLGEKIDFWQGLRPQHIFRMGDTENQGTLVELDGPLGELDYPLVFTVSQDLRLTGLATGFLTQTDITNSDNDLEVGDVIRVAAPDNRIIFLLILRRSEKDDFEYELLKTAMSNLFFELDEDEKTLAMPQITIGLDGTLWETVRQEMAEALTDLGISVVVHSYPEYPAESINAFDPFFKVEKIDILEVDAPIIIDISVNMASSAAGVRQIIKRRHNGFGEFDLKVFEMGDVLHIPPSEKGSRNHVFYVFNRLQDVHDPVLTAYKQGLERVRMLCHQNKITTVYTIKLPFLRKSITANQIRDTIKSVFSESGIRVILAVGGS